MTVKDFRKKIEELPDNTEIAFSEEMNLSFDNMAFTYHDLGKVYHVGKNGKISSKRYLIISREAQDDGKEIFLSERRDD